MPSAFHFYEHVLGFVRDLVSSQDVCNLLYFVSRGHYLICWCKKRGHSTTVGQQLRFFVLFCLFVNVGGVSFSLYMCQVEWELPLDDAGCGEKDHARLFRWSSVPHRKVDNLCVKCFDLRQQTTGLGRLRQMDTIGLYRFVCTLNKLSAVIHPGILLPHSSTDSDRYAGTTTIHD